MKKYVFAIVLTAAMLLALIACNGDDVQETSMTANNSQTTTQTATAYPDIYIFHESTDMGIYFSIHPAWHGLFGVIESLAEHDKGNTRTLVAYHIATRNEFGMGEIGGVLFWINSLPNTLFTEIAEGFDGIILAQRNGYAYTLNYPRGFEYLYDPDSPATAQYLDMIEYLQPWNDNFVTNSFRLVGTDTFAAALSEYFSDSKEGFDFSTKAVLVSVDNNDTPAVLAIRHEVRYDETGHDMPIPVARIFYLYEGELGAFDVPTFQDDPHIWVTVEGRPVQSGGHWTLNWITLYGIEDGRLTSAFTLFTKLDNDDIHGANPRHYRSAGGWQDGFESRSPITQEEFVEIISRYRLVTSGYGADVMASWRDLADETE